MKIKSAFFILIFGISIFTGFSQEEAKENPAYLFPEFTSAKVKFKTGNERSMKLNYNLLTEEVVFDNNGTLLAFANPESTDTLYILDKRFAYIDNKFYEVLENLPIPLLVRHYCTVIPPGENAGYGTTSQTSAIQTPSTLYTSRSGYNMKLPDNYKVMPEVDYIVRIGNTLDKVYNLNQVIKCFPEKKNEIKDFTKKNKTSFKKQEDVRKLIRFCNQ